MTLIDREAAIAAIQSVEELYEREEDMDSAEAVMSARWAVQEIQAVDAVEVVRCRECQYWQQEVNPQLHWVCTQHSFNERLLHTQPDFFCADGKVSR